MADASSSDTTSDCCNECFSDITSEKSEYVVVGRKPCPSHRRSKRNLLQKLLIREVGRPDPRDPSGTVPRAVKSDSLPAIKSRASSRENTGSFRRPGSVSLPARCWLNRSGSTSTGSECTSFKLSFFFSF